MSSIQCANCHCVRSTRATWVVYDGQYFCSGICYRRFFNIPSYGENNENLDGAMDIVPDNRFGKR